jgi:hypothetical protein
MDLCNFLSKEALKLFLETKGWKMNQPIVIEEKAVFKPDFYAENYTIAQGKYGRICAKGHSIINYQGNTFESVDMLISKHGQVAFEDFDNWEFVEEMEWVIYRKADWIFSFSTLLELPKASKYRC